MMSMQEQKQADSLRGDKDDFKRQSAELRQGGAILPADPLAPRATVPLEPTVQVPRKMEHAAIDDVHTQSTISSSASVSASGPAMMAQVGEQAGAGLEAAKAKLQPLVEPVVAKATALYEQATAPSTSTGPSIQERATLAAGQAQTLYNDKLAPALTDAANKAGPILSNAAAQAGPMLSNAAAQAKPILASASAQAQVAAAQARPVIEQAIEQAKPILANAAATAQKIYAEQVQPALASGLSAAQEQIGVIREDGLSVTMEKAGTAYQRRVASAKTTIAETYEAKVPLEQREQIAKAQKVAAKQVRVGWNRVLDIWESQALPYIRERNLQAPLAIAGSVLLLLLGWSLLSALSASKASHEQVVVYQPNWRPSNGPVQGVEMPGLMDKAKMHIDSVDGKIIDSVELLKARTADLAQHAEDRVAMGIEELKVRAAELQQGIPSAAELKARADSTLDSARAAMPGSHPAPLKDESVLGSLKANAADLKARVNAAVHPAPVKEATVLDNLKDSAADLKARVNSAIHPAPVKEATVLDNLKESAADLKARVHSATHPAPVKEATVLDHLKDGAADLKARAEATLDTAKLHADNAKLHAENLALRAESNIHSARANIPSTADIKARADSTLESAKARADSTLESAKASIPAAQAPVAAKHSELRLKINDRLEHIAHLLPEQLSALKLRLGDLYERLTPAQRHYAHAHPEILDPENHAVSFVDSNGNVKSILDVDLE